MSPEPIRPDVPPEPPARGLTAVPEQLRELALTQRYQLDGLRREIRNLGMVLDALGALLEADADSEPFSAVFAVIGPLFRFSHAVVMVDDERSERLRCLASTEPDLVDSLWTPTSMTSKVLAGRVVATVAPHRASTWPAEATRLGLAPEQPALYLPLRVRDQRGLMMLLRPDSEPGFDRRDVAVARKLSVLASQALATKRANRVERERRDLRRLTRELQAARDDLAQRANHDALTGLASRGYFEAQARAAIDAMPPGRQLALAFIDVDGFKQVNDYYGHDIGDALLVEVARRLERHLAGDTDIAARISGDEFMVMANPISGRDGLMAAIVDGLGQLRRPFLLDGRQIMVSASVGVAIYPDHGTTFDELRRNADMAMYRAKHASRGGVEMYVPSMGTAAANRLDQEQELRRAVVERRFRAAVQPKIDLETMRVVGFEVLARQVDESGTVGDSAGFIDLAIQTGLLDEITGIVLDDALTALPALDATFGDATTFSVNVSTRQATDRVLLRSLLDRLVGSGYARRFTLEVTEDALMSADVFRDEIMPMIAAAGIEVSIDDFGTGFASLSRLLTVTAHEIKIDRSFVTALPSRPRSQVMLRAMETIGWELGATVVAEGIETVEELNYLRGRTRVRVAQGFYFSRPLIAGELIAAYPALERRLTEARGPVLRGASPQQPVA